MPTKQKLKHFAGNTKVQAKPQPGHPIPPAFTPDKHPFWKPLFIVTVLAASLIMLISGWGTGFHSDEMDQNAYGKAAIKYYASGGKDTSYLTLKLPNGEKVAEAIKTYGVLFDMGMNTVTRFVAPKYEYDVRHLMIQIVGLLSMLMASLIVYRLTGGYRSALITFIIIYLTPVYFGHSLMNSRDIPFALGYTLGLYAMILFFQNFRSLKYKYTLGLALAIGFAMSVRIGGLILFVVFGFMLFYFIITDKAWRTILTDKRRIGRHLIHGALLLAIPYGIAVFSHPYIISSPIAHFLYCIQTAQKFPNRIPLNFKGEYIDSLTIPSDFIPTWMSITIPVAVFLFFIAGFIFLVVNRRRVRQRHYFVLLLFASLFPIAYAIKNSFALYTGWRHLLFVYPAAAVLAGWWFEYIRFRERALNFALPVLVLFSLSHPVYWMLKNHPYEYIYFNETSGGFAKNYYLYETDGWQLSVRKAIAWIREQEDFKKNKHNIIATNCYSPTWTILRDYYGDTSTKVQQSGFRAKNVVDWNYMVINVNLLPPNYLDKQYPPATTIKTIDVDGKPICAIMYDPVRNDFSAIQAVTTGNYGLADSLLALCLAQDPLSEQLIAAHTNCKAALGEWDESYKICSRGLEVYPENFTMLYYYALYHARRDNYKVAIDKMVKAFEFGYPRSKYALGQLAQMYRLSGDETMAKKVDNLAKDYD